jgi:hypothetical protein
MATYLTLGSPNQQCKLMLLRKTVEEAFSTKVRSRLGKFFATEGIYTYFEASNQHNR